MSQLNDIAEVAQVSTDAAQLMMISCIPFIGPFIAGAVIAEAVVQAPAYAEGYQDGLDDNPSTYTAVNGRASGRWVPSK